MAGSNPEVQAANVVPPRFGSVAALGVDVTARSYDLTALAFGGNTYNSPSPEEVFITFFADGGDVYLSFDSVTHATLDNTAAIAAGGTLAFGNTHAAKIASGTKERFRLRRNVDKFIQVKTASGTATLRMWASSEPTGGTK